MLHAGVLIRFLITNRADDGLMEKPKLVHCVVYGSGLNIYIRMQDEVTV